MLCARLVAVQVVHTGLGHELGVLAEGLGRAADQTGLQETVKGAVDRTLGGATTLAAALAALTVLATAMTPATTGLLRDLKGLGHRGCGLDVGQLLGGLGLHGRCLVQEHTRRVVGSHATALGKRSVAHRQRSAAGATTLTALLATLTVATTAVGLATLTMPTGVLTVVLCHSTEGRDFPRVLRLVAQAGY